MHPLVNNCNPLAAAATARGDSLYHRNWRNHPVIGFGLGPNNGPGTIERSAAFILLQDLDGITRSIPGDNGSLMTLDIEPGRGIYIDLMKVWNWTAENLRSYAKGLRDTNLITEALYLELLPKTSKNARGQITKTTRASILAKTNGLCAYCGCTLTTQKDKPNTFHADHVLPVAKGGTDDIANLIPSCAKCNGKKSAKSFLSFLGRDDQ